MNRRFFACLFAAIRNPRRFPQINDTSSNISPLLPPDLIPELPPLFSPSALFLSFALSPPSTSALSIALQPPPPQLHL